MDRSRSIQEEIMTSNNNNNNNNNKLYLLIHTMTVTECDYILRAEFFHTFTNNLNDLNNARLIARRLSLRIHPNLRANRNKLRLQRLIAPNLKTLMKRNSASVKHHLRTIHINPPQTQPVVQQRKIENSQVNRNDIPKKLSPNNCFAKITNTEAVNEVEQLSLSSTPDETIQWLKNNRFENYSQDFTNFSGSDMFRMSRDDFIQICGHADGIRLFNVLHSKTITPKLKIYVCKEKSTVFNAIFLSSYCNEELVKKLSTLVGISENRVRDIYIEGPQSIHVHLNNDLLKHIKEDTMFMVEIIQDSDEYYVLLLKRAINS